MEPKDIFELRAVGDVVLHPDERSVVFTIGWPDAESDANRSLLHTINIDGSNHKQISEGHLDYSPRFSPDGTILVFIRVEADGQARLMASAWSGTETNELTSKEIDRFTDGPPLQLQWIDDRRLAFLAPQRPVDQVGVDADELARRPRILTSIDYRFNRRGYINDRRQQVFVLDVDLGAEPVTDEAEPRRRAVGLPETDHMALAVSPDGRHIVATAGTDPDTDLTAARQIWRYDITSSGDAPLQLTTKGQHWYGLFWHPEGSLLAAATTDVDQVGFSHLHQIRLPESGNDPTAIAESPPSIELFGTHDLHIMAKQSPANDVAMIEGAMLLPGVRRGRIAVDRYDLADATRSVIYESDNQVSAFSAGADGTPLIGAVTSSDRPAELWRLDGEPRPLLALNQDLLDTLDLANITTTMVRSTDGVDVEAFIVKPPASVPASGTDGRYPGLIYVHGGPMFQFGHSFFDEFQIAAAAGFVVVAGNPRGSDGYGQAWATSIVGDLGNKDWADVAAMADHLGDLPEVDEERRGIGGGSYGGFMTGWALSHDSSSKPRFKAGLIERAVTSWTTMFGTSDIGNWFTRMNIGANIESDPREVERQSPLTHAANIAVPTLIIHSEEDWRCPIEQAEQLFAAIRRNGGDTTLVRFPGENHELSRSGKPQHRVERFEIIHEFFARHLGGQDFNTNHLG